jgi:hypothetical protein
MHKTAVIVIPGWCVSTRPGISRFSDVQLHIVVRCFASPRNDGGLLSFNISRFRIAPLRGPDIR